MGAIVARQDNFHKTSQMGRLRLAGYLRTLTNAQLFAIKTLSMDVSVQPEPSGQNLTN